jgi:hypothetical protein
LKIDKRQLDDAFFAVRDKAVRKLTDASDGFGVKIVSQDTPGGPLNVLDFSQSTIVNKNHQDVLQRAFNEVQRWTDTTPAGLDTLKKRLGQIKDNIPVTESGGARAYLSGLTSDVANAIKKNVPEYQKMTGKYAEASDLIDEIERTLSLKEGRTTDTAIRKLMSVMRQNNELRLDLLKTLQETGAGDISGKLAASTLAPLAPRGLAGTFASPIGITGLLTGNIGQTLLYLAAASPRLVAEFLSALASVQKIGDGPVPIMLRRKFERIFKEAGEAATKALRAGAVEGVTDEPTF